MLFNRRSSSSPTPARDADDRWLMADLEAAQRRDIYAAGRGDGRRRRRRPKRELRHR